MTAITGVASGMVNAGCAGVALVSGRSHEASVRRQPARMPQRVVMMGFMCSTNRGER